MRKNVCWFGDSYSEDILWYDDQTNQFFVDQYHWGSVDDERFFDGTAPIDPLSALQKMIQYDRLQSVLTYYDELNVACNLDAALAQMKPNGRIYDDAFQAKPDYRYYSITDDEYAIYFAGTFLSVKRGRQGVVDFSVVRRILENSRTVTRHQYDYHTRSWTSVCVGDALHR